MEIIGITNQFDLELLKIEHYVKYPSMIPWIGQSYGKRYKKVLFVGESHYLPKDSIAQLRPEQWYQSSQDLLIDEELKYINTRYALSINCLRNGIWRIPGQLMNNQKIFPPPNSNNVYEWFCYYNFFQRPAEKEGDGLKICDLDIKEANKVFYTNIKILKPDIVLFLSSKAFYNSNIKGFKDIIFDFVPHPSSNWWNRKSLKYAIDGKIPLTGREKFEKLLTGFHRFC